jgi:hypothetical protein
MRCRVVREEIDAAGARGAQPMENPEIRAHLEKCSACAEYARASGFLHRSLTRAAADDSVDIIPLKNQRVTVEARLARGVKPERRHSPRWLRRPALAGSLVVAVLAVVTLVPFSYYRTIGYDLNLDGVSLEIGQDDEVVCDLLHRLGLTEAGVDLHDCDSTCSLSILDLKSEREAYLVVGAIARLSESEVTTDLVPIRTRHSRSLLEKAIGHSDS